MRVFVDGREIELSPGANLSDAIGKSGAYIAPGAIVGMVKGRGEKSRQTNSYWLNTTKGKLRIELLDSELQSIWHESVDRIIGSTVRWSSADGVAFGPFSSKISFSRDAQEYSRWEVVLGAAGFDRENTQIIFVRRRHAAAYGTPIDGGVVGHIVGGKNTLDRLATGDRIEGIEPIVEWQEITEKQATLDQSLPLEEGMEIFTAVDAELDENAPLGAEFFLALTQEGTLKVDALSSSYISSDQLLREPMVFENREPRLEGAVTVRTAGRGLGRIFVYKKDRTSSPGHSVIARILSGMDMIKLAGPGQKITIKVRPERIMLLGSSLKDALSQMESMGIQAQAEGYQGDDAVVVKQDPGTTMAILKGKKVLLHGMPSSRMVAISLFDDLAPKTLDYFRHVTGLKERPLGPLPVYFVYENTLLFKPDIDATSYKELLPENKPTGPVPAGSIAVSNTVSKKVGMVGIKLAEDKRYGPSGEKFEATNIIGRVLEPEKLKDVQEGETIYIMEVR
ncbi:MAG: putative methanosis marker protein 3 [Methanomicrobia archaeon]|nr:putative methanosis marker protein 3 [Methanomicrobia archaeon]